MTRVKICGLTTPETVDAAVEAGADYLGFMLYPRSPRALSAEQAAPLMARAAGRTRRVAVLVDPDDAAVDAAAALQPDLIQLHGRETPARAEMIRRRTNRPVIKVIPIGAAGDLSRAKAYTADHLMFETAPPPGADRPGGHGVAFDWSILPQTLPPSRPEPRSGAEPGPPRADNPWSLPREVPGRPAAARDDGVLGGLWFLAGGLTSANVAEAVRVTGAPVVDVSSGVESAPGVKDAALIAAFVRAAKAAS